MLTKFYRSATALAAFGLLAMLATNVQAKNQEPTYHWIEAESFAERGGWKIDQQYMDQMGSPVLLAHGMGKPVADAVTSFENSKAQKLHVFVRTRDWAATWNGKNGVSYTPEQAPGRFQLLINGKPLATTFGTEGAEWHWQDGGTVNLPKGKVTVALRDLTGFAGRCDAICLISDHSLSKIPKQPWNLGGPLDDLRIMLCGKKVNDATITEEYDLVVVGGGTAGICSAISAARLGQKVALVQNRPVLGGNNSSEVRVHLGGKIHLPPYAALGAVIREIDSGKHGNAKPAHHYDDDRKMRVTRAEENITLYLSTHVNGAEMKGKRISAVIGTNIQTNERIKIRGKLFADCTGDGCLGYLAGADFRYGRESKKETGEKLAPEKADRQVLGSSVQWYSVPSKTDDKFPACPWAMQFNEKTAQRVMHGEWNWENGFFRDQIKEAEYIRDFGLRAAYGNCDFLKNRAKDKAKYAGRTLGWVAYVAGKRESRRLLGDVILKQQDVTGAVKYPDASFVTTWSIDLHYPVPVKGMTEEPFRSVAHHHRNRPYAVPYRCLYSRNIENLFMAGRNISVTHVALGTIRVMRTTGMMGEVVGMAASIASKHNTTPRGVYEKHLDELKERMSAGVGKGPIPGPKPGHGKIRLQPLAPAWIKKAGPNLARSAKATASSQFPAVNYPVANVNDGRVSYSDNALRYVSAAQMPGQVTLTWDKPQRIGATRIVSGQAGAKTPNSDFVIQYRKGGKWIDIPKTKTKGNLLIDWGATFEPVTTDALRLHVTAAPGNLIRIWEWEVYGPVKKD